MFKRKSIIIFFGAIIFTVILLVNFIQQNYVAPIIMYHSISLSAQPKNSLVVSEKTFERQMRFLKSQHYNIVPLETVIALIKEKKKIPPKTLAITFDDGFKDNYTYAFPILKKYNFPAIVFIIVNEVGRIQGDRLSWDEIKAMQDSGLITFGSHTIGPTPLTEIKSVEELKRQVFDSKSMLEEKLGQRVNIFSYPHGIFNAKIRQLVIDAGYLGAVATSPGRGYPNDDVFALKRLKVSENAANMFIFAVETSGFYTFMKEFKKRNGKK